MGANSEIFRRGGAATLSHPGRVAELAGAQASGACVRKDVGVQVPPRPPRLNGTFRDDAFGRSGGESSRTTTLQTDGSQKDARATRDGTSRRRDSSGRRM